MLEQSCEDTSVIQVALKCGFRDHNFARGLRTLFGFRCRVTGLQGPRLSNSATHCRYLALSLRDDVLSQTPKLVIVTVFELGASYINRAMMVGHHCRNEIAIDVACWTDQHTQAHFAYGKVVFEYEILLAAVDGGRGDAALCCLVLCQGNGSRQDHRYCRRQRDEPLDWTSATKPHLTSVTINDQSPRVHVQHGRPTEPTP